MNGQKQELTTEQMKNNSGMMDELLTFIMSGEMITWYEGSMKKLEKKGLQNDPLYLSMAESKKYLENGKLELEANYKRIEQHRKGNITPERGQYEKAQNSNNFVR